MKKLFFTILLCAVCFGAFAQESAILDSWEDKIESKEDKIISTFSYLDFTYNHNLAAPTGYNASGWGFELSFFHLGFKPWEYGRFTLGLFDMAFDFGYLLPDNSFIQVSNKIETVPNLDKSNKSTYTNIAYTFPVGLIQNFGKSKWAAAFLVCPGMGWQTFRNETVIDNIRTTESFRVNRDRIYFRLDLKAMIWYDNFGFVVRYAFPRSFQGAGVISAGLSFKL